MIGIIKKLFAPVEQSEKLVAIGQGRATPERDEFIQSAHQKYSVQGIRVYCVDELEYLAKNDFPARTDYKFGYSVGSGQIIRAYVPEPFSEGGYLSSNPIEPKNGQSAMQYFLKLYSAQEAKFLVDNDYPFSSSYQFEYQHPSGNIVSAVDTMLQTQMGRKFDSGKPRFSLLPTDALHEVVKVLEVGAVKYAADNWKKVDNHRDRYFNASMRHLLAWWEGERNDPETGLNHLAHASCNVLFLLWFDLQEKTGNAN